MYISPKLTDAEYAEEKVMVICVPVGNPNKTPSGFWEDETRLPEYYDGTYKYLKSLDIEEI